MKVTKKPIQVDAILWDGTANAFNEMQELGLKFKPGEMGSNSFYIETLEGDMIARKGDWVIKGVEGEFYPCKPGIFEKTYQIKETKNER